MSEIERLRSRINEQNEIIRRMKDALRMIADDPKSRVAVREIASIALRKDKPNVN